jgi:SAM-dependent methyltransferase
LAIRDQIGENTLVGNGLEIGAQQVPTRVSSDKARVEYVDRLTAEETASRFAIPRELLVDVTHISDGAKLETVADESKDFVIANHVLEHFDDPIGAIVEWLRILKPQGRLFISLPNRTGNPFDFRRKPADLSHLKRDFRDVKYRVANNRAHYADMVRTIYGFEASNPLILATADEWIRLGERHHYHVYNYEILHSVLATAADYMDISLKTVCHFAPAKGYEILLVVERGAFGTAGYQCTNDWLRQFSATCRLGSWLRHELKQGRTFAVKHG